MIKFSTREKRRDERGFALVTVLLIAFLYFALIQLMLFESTEAFRGAQRYRSRVIAQIAAENAAELAAADMADGFSKDIEEENDQSLMEASYNRGFDGDFEIDASAESKGVSPTRATVHIEGRVHFGQIVIERTIHSQ